MGPGFIFPSIYGYKHIGTGSVKNGKLATKDPWIYGYLLQCGAKTRQECVVNERRVGRSSEWTVSVDVGLRTSLIIASLSLSLSLSLSVCLSVCLSVTGAACMLSSSSTCSCTRVYCRYLYTTACWTLWWMTGITGMQSARLYALYTSSVFRLFVSVHHLFVCIAKTCTEIEKTYSYATRQAAMATLEMMYPARGVWIGVRWGGVLSEVGGYTPS